MNNLIPTESEVVTGEKSKYEALRLPNIAITREEHKEANDKFEAIQKKFLFRYRGFYTLLLLRLAYTVFVEGKQVKYDPKKGLESN